MRHVPTSLYIDTEVFKRNDLRLDTNDFQLLKDTLGNRGLRLLVPQMMERELFRHYENRARDSARDLEKAHTNHPIGDLSLVDLPPRTELEEKCYRELYLSWEAFKGHFVVEHLPLIGSLDDVVNWYFNVQPPFSETNKKEFPDAFILSSLEEYHHKHNANIAVVTSDGEFGKACQQRSHIDHYKSLQNYVKAFEPAHAEGPSLRAY